MVPLSPFNTPASIQMFHQLYKIALKFVEKNNLQETKKVKQGHDDINFGQDSQSLPVVKSATSTITVCISVEQKSRVDFAPDIELPT